MFGNWGDNLAGDAKLKAGSPIRVEIVLTNSADYRRCLTSTWQGYTVLKLEPSTLDRLSAYGHDAVLDEADVWVATPRTPSCRRSGWCMTPACRSASRTWTPASSSVPLQPIAPEINATGKIVYGYNLRVTAAGTYQIRFTTTPAVTFTGVDVGDL